MIDILDENGNKANEVMDIREAHKNYKYHKSIHLWIIHNGKILLQHRSINLKYENNKWDSAVTGHVDSGENSISATIRETKEEIGVSLEQDHIKYLYTYCVNEFENYEFRDIYLYDGDIDLSNTNVPNHEVDELKWVNIDEIESLFTNNPNYVLKDSIQLNKLCNLIKNNE